MSTASAARRRGLGSNADHPTSAGALAQLKFLRSTAVFLSDRSRRDADLADRGRSQQAAICQSVACDRGSECRGQLRAVSHRPENGDRRRKDHGYGDDHCLADADGIEPGEIGVFVRSPEVIGRARAALEASGLADRVAVSVMHLAKGLEFRAVAVMACDQDILPLASRIPEAADEGELDDIYETERQLLYVSCTRARDRLLVTGVAPGSEFLKDL
jgi:UvrD-like helicase C-terminal domain